MAQRRRNGEHLGYAEWHRNALPHLYQRYGHRLDLADRDWTEFCNACKEPLAIYEEVLDRNQSLTEKATTVTRRLAERAGLQSFLIAPRFETPPDVEAEMAYHHARLRELEAQYPMLSISAQRLTPRKEPMVLGITPAEWAEQIAILHREHHAQCDRARRRSDIGSVRSEGLARARRRSLFFPDSEAELPLGSDAG